MLFFDKINFKVGKALMIINKNKSFPKFFLALLLLSCQASPDLATQQGPSISQGNNNFLQLNNNMLKKVKELHNQLNTSSFRQQYHEQYLKNFTPLKAQKNNAFRIQSTNISIFTEDFSSVNSGFGDGTNGWIEWGGDYTPAPGSPGKITLINPMTHSQTLQTGLSKTLNLQGQAGDTIIAKMKVNAQFTGNSDSTLVLYFNDGSQTTVATDTARGVHAGEQTLFLETVIPSGATQVTLAPLVYLEPGEQGSILIDEISLEEIPDDFYTKTPLLQEPFDQKIDNNYGTNSPAGVDEEFGYDFYVVDDWPLKYPNDGAVTVWNPGVGSHSSPEGGLIKRVNLNTIQSGDLVTASLFTSATFTDPNSTASLKLAFFDVNDFLLHEETSNSLRGNNYKWQIFDRIAIPESASYVKLTPLVKLGASETSSLLWGSLQLHHYRTSQAPNPSQDIAQATIGSDGGVVEIPGFARLEIPAGALTTNTQITIEKPAGLRESLPGLESLSTETAQEPAHEYASEVVKISPMGLELAKPAKLFLAPDSTRLGTNHPASAPVFLTEDLSGGKHWEGGTMEIPAPGVEEWPENLPCFISKLSYAARFIPSDVSPSDGLKPFILNHSPDESGFNTQQYNPYPTPTPEPSVFVGDYPGASKFITFRSNNISFDFQKDVHNHLDSVYLYYDQLMSSINSQLRPNPFYSQAYVDTNGEQQVVKGIPVYLRTTLNDIGSGKTTTQFALIRGWGASNIVLNLPLDGDGNVKRDRASELSAHELWHAFQYSNTASETYSSIPIIMANFMHEGTAEYMGALCYYKIPFPGLDPTQASTNSPPHYESFVELNRQSMDIPIPDRQDNSGGIDLDKYSTTSFFTSLDANYGIFNNVHKGTAIAKLADFYHTNGFASTPTAALSSVLGGAEQIDYYYNLFGGKDEASKSHYYSLSNNNWGPTSMVKARQTYTLSPPPSSTTIANISGELPRLSTHYFRVRFENLTTNMEKRHTVNIRPKKPTPSWSELNTKTYVSTYFTRTETPSVREYVNTHTLDLQYGMWLSSPLPPHASGPWSYTPGQPLGLASVEYLIAIPSVSDTFYAVDIDVTCEEYNDGSSYPFTPGWKPCDE